MIAKALEENGAKVFIVGRRKDVLESVAQKEAVRFDAQSYQPPKCENLFIEYGSDHRFSQKFGNLIPVVGDVTSKIDLQRITERISSEVGYINLLVANAGTTGPMFGDKISICGPDQSPLSDVQKDLWNIDQDTFLNTFKANIGGPFWSIVAFLPLLDAGNRKGNVVQSSQVVATGSEAAYDRIPIPHYTYSASKAGLTHMMKQFATTFVKYKIRFNVIAPGRKFSSLSTLTMGQ